MRNPSNSSGMSSDCGRSSRQISTLYSPNLCFIQFNNFYFREHLHASSGAASPLPHPPQPDSFHILPGNSLPPRTFFPEPPSSDPVPVLFQKPLETVSLSHSVPAALRAPSPGPRRTMSPPGRRPRASRLAAVAAGDREIAAEYVRSSLYYFGENGAAFRRKRCDTREACLFSKLG